MQREPNTLKWTDKQPYERSRRMKHQIEFENKEIETSAYMSALHHDENTWDILNKSEEFNKREELGSKLSYREPVQQIGNNPFLDQNNYANDVDIQNQFLKPINTTQGREPYKER